MKTVDDLVDEQGKAVCVHCGSDGNESDSLYPLAICINCNARVCFPCMGSHRETCGKKRGAA